MFDKVLNTLLLLKIEQSFDNKLFVLKASLPNNYDLQLTIDVLIPPLHALLI